MYGWRARIGNILPTACVEILPYEFYRVALEKITFATTHWVVYAQESTVSGFKVARVRTP